MSGQVPSLVVTVGADGQPPAAVPGPGPGDVLHAVFDMEVAAPGPAFLDFLVLADIAREERKLDTIHAVIVPPRRGALRGQDGDGPLADRDWQLAQYCIAAICLLPACTGYTFCESQAQAAQRLAGATHIHPAGYALERPATAELRAAIEAAAWAGHRVDRLRATEQARLYVRRWLRNVAGDRQVVAITPNGNGVATGALASLSDELVGRGFMPVLVRGPGSVAAVTGTTLDRLPEFPVGVANIELLAAFYAEAHLNVGGDQLASTLWRGLKELPYLTVAAPNEYGGEEYVSPPFLRGCQSICRGDATAADLSDALWDLIGRIDAGEHTRTPTGEAEVDRERMAYARESQLNGRYHDALVIFLALLERHPGDADVRFHVGAAFYDTQDYARAAEFLLPLRATHTLDMRFVDLLSRTFVALENDAEAEALLRPVLARYPNDPRPLVQMGDVHMLRHEAADAAECYRRALSLGAATSDVQPKLARACLAMGRPDEAVRLLRSVLHSGQIDVDTLDVLVRALEGLGRSELATVCRNATAALGLGLNDALDTVNMALSRLQEDAA